MKHPKKLTTLVILTLVALELITILGGAIADIYLGYTYGAEYTISWVVLETSHSYPIIPFAAALIFICPRLLLAGHLFWTHRGDNILLPKNKRKG